MGRHIQNVGEAHGGSEPALASPSPGAHVSLHVLLPKRSLARLSWSSGDGNMCTSDQCMHASKRQDRRVGTPSRLVEEERHTLQSLAETFAARGASDLLHL